MSDAFEKWWRNTEPGKRTTRAAWDAATEAAAERRTMDSLTYGELLKERDVANARIRELEEALKQIRETDIWLHGACRCGHCHQCVARAVLGREEK